MEIKFRTSLKGIGKYGITQSLSAIFRIITGIHLETFQAMISVDMFNSDCLPYEASRAYRSMMTEFECKRSMVMTEAQRQNIRGL